MLACAWDIWPFSQAMLLIFRYLFYYLLLLSLLSLFRYSKTSYRAGAYFNVSTKCQTLEKTSVFLVYFASARMLKDKNNTCFGTIEHCISNLANPSIIIMMNLGKPLLSCDPRL